MDIFFFHYFKLSLPFLKSTIQFLLIKWPKETWSHEVPNPLYTYMCVHPTPLLILSPPIRGWYLLTALDPALHALPSHLLSGSYHQLFRLYFLFPLRPHNMYFPFDLVFISSFHLFQHPFLPNTQNRLSAPIFSPLFIPTMPKPMAELWHLTGDEYYLKLCFCLSFFIFSPYSQMCLHPHTY